MAIEILGLVPLYFKTSCCVRPGNTSNIPALGVILIFSAQIISSQPGSAIVVSVFS